MKVILLQEISGLGKAGEVKEVAPGYARNFLLAKKFAVEATPSQLRNLSVQHEIKKRQVEIAKKSAEALAQRLESIRLVFRVRLGEQMRMYGSITSQDIAEKLQAEYGITVERRDIELEEPIKALGDHTVTAKLGPGIKGKMVVEVAQIEEAAPAAPAPAAKEDLPVAVIAEEALMEEAPVAEAGVDEDDPGALLEEAGQEA